MKKINYQKKAQTSIAKVRQERAFSLLIELVKQFPSGWSFSLIFYLIWSCFDQCNNQMLQQKESRTQQKECNKIFSFANMSCKLNNCSVIKKRENQDVETDNLINHPSQCQDNIIKKVFQLQFPHHTIIIHDTLTIAYHPFPLHSQQLYMKNDSNNPHLQNSNKKDQNKKLILFRSSITKEPSQMKGDKKNIAKNVVTAFINYLRECKQEGQNFDPQIENLKELIDKTKFNNQLITLIVANSQLRHYFRIFLNSSAMSWVQHSKLKNKQIHIKAIEIYGRLCEDKQSKSQQNEEKERMEIPIDSDENEYYFQSAINHELEDEIKQFK